MKARRRLRIAMRKTFLRQPLVWLRNLGLRQDDVLMAGYPKSGNTWLAFLVTHIVTGRETDFLASAEMIPYVGFRRGVPRVLPNGGRMFKTHERHSPRNPRAVYIVRDGRDVLISAYYHIVRLGFFEGSLDAFFDEFLCGRGIPYGSWQDHVLGWVTCPAYRDGKIHVVKYEGLLSQPVDELRSLMAFLGVEASEKLLEESVEANRAARMRSKAGTPRIGVTEKGKGYGFVRKARSGQWKEMLSEEQIARFNEAASEALRRIGYEH